ncbi:hypothetical protein [Paenibacillus beijingensis]|uniref:Uncharacterized protein n=1 Tax=Paenibacillus beijingensis TaxID=1126833 RepID=A0A0D5NFY5_9BACL|nr:hypothetical protein [Paenibacillus beijingensis]AJY74289.1 hypothetical protein VN24_06465 [Paenibacillus beijingensis]
MKKNKWLKWKIGGAFMIGITAIFQTVRTSVLFEAKTADAASSKTSTTDSAQQQQDLVIDEWSNQRPNPDDGTGFRHHRRGNFQGQDGGQFDNNGQSGSSSGSGGSFDDGSSGSGSFGGGSSGGGSGFDSSTGRS